MANEITVTTRLAVENGKHKDTFAPPVLKINQAAIGASSGVVSVGTSEEDLAVGDVTTLGWVALRNLDSTNYVTYGPKSGSDMVAFGRINAGETALLRLAQGITVRWAANTAAVKVQVLLLQN